MFHNILITTESCDFSFGFFVNVWVLFFGGEDQRLFLTVGHLYINFTLVSKSLCPKKLSSIVRGDRVNKLIIE